MDFEKVNGKYDLVETESNTSAAAAQVSKITAAAAAKANTDVKADPSYLDKPTQQLVS